MNEDSRGITPPDVTSMTVEPHGPGWRVTIEQGNGSVIKLLELSFMECAQLGMILNGGSGVRHVSFTDPTRPALGWPVPDSEAE